MPEDQIIHLNGEFLPLRDARISPLDRGFIFGDGAYDVIPVYGRHPFRGAQHLDRLRRSLRELRIWNPHTREEWQDIIHQLIALHPTADMLVYLHVTRGVAPRAHGFPQGVTPTVFAMTMPLRQPAPELRASGVVCSSAPDQRWTRCDIKSISLLGNILAAQRAVDAGTFETIQFRDGRLTEGASSNVWIVQGGRVLAPMANHHVLRGVRYRIVTELCGQLQIPWELRDIHREEVLAADEVLLTSASKEILPVVRIDDQAIGNGTPGPLGRRLYDAYQGLKRESAEAS